MMHSDSDAHRGAGSVLALAVMATAFQPVPAALFDVVTIKETGLNCCMSITLWTQKYTRPAMILCNTVQC